MLIPFHTQHRSKGLSFFAKVSKVIESQKQERVRTEIAKITSVTRDSGKAINGIKRSRQVIADVYGNTWLEEDQWVQVNWLTSNDKNALQGALQWYDGEIKRLAAEVNTRRRWHLCELGLLSILSAVIAWSNSTKFIDVTFNQDIFFLLVLSTILVGATMVLACVPVLREVPVFTWAVFPGLYPLIEPWLTELQRHDFSISLLLEQWRTELQLPLIVFTSIIGCYVLVYSCLWMFLSERYIKSRTTLWTWVMAGCFLSFSVLGVTAFALERKGGGVFADVIDKIVDAIDVPRSPRPHDQ